MEMHSLLKEKMLLVVPAAASIWRRRRERISMREIAAASLLPLQDGHCCRDDILEISRKARLKPRVAFDDVRLCCF